MNILAKSLLTILACLSLISCASGTKPTQVIIEKNKIAIEQEWLQKCGDLTLLTKATKAEILRNHTMTAQLYHFCHARLNALQEAVRKHNESVDKFNSENQ